MHYRPFGATEVLVSEIGFGAWGIGGGWGATDDEEAAAAIHRYLDLGGNLIDTAYVYGDGHSEKIIGAVLKERKADAAHPVFLATKVPPKTMSWPPRRNTPVTETFPKEWVIACAERSLKYLGVETLDLLQLHAWLDDYNEQLDWFEAFEELKAAGKVRYFGVSINDYVPETGVRLAKSGRIHAIQVIYNIFEQTPEQELFVAAQQNGVAILPRVPFEEGALTGAINTKTVFHPDDWRGEYFTAERLAEIERRTNALHEHLDENTDTLALLALRFCLHSSTVTSVLPGMRRTSNVEANMKASDYRLSAETLARLREHDWDHGWKYPWCDTEA